MHTALNQPSLVFPASQSNGSVSADAISSQLLAAREQSMQLVASLAAQLQSLQSSGFSRADGRPDVFRQVTGQSSMEAAIADARRLVEQYDRLLNELPGANAQGYSNGANGQAAATIEAQPIVLRGSFRAGPATIARTG